MTNKLAVLGVSAGIVVAAAAGLAISVPTLAGAQANPGVTVASSGTTTAPVPDADRKSHLENTLAPLVKDGTITQAQADKVIAALEAAKPAGKGFGGMHGPGRRGAGLDTAASALGMTPADLRTALQSGKSIADVAKDKNVPVQKVIDALVAERKTHLDQAVADKRITQAQADQRLADATTEITAMVNGTMPAGGFGPGGMMGGRHGHGPWSGTAPSSQPDNADDAN